MRQEAGLSFLSKVVEIKKDEAKALAVEKYERKKKLLPSGRFVIAEIKKASPTLGKFAGGVNVAEKARLFEKAGAAAISVLTDNTWFAGSYEDLRAVAQAAAVPVLMKDFVIDARQIEAGAASGADMILLMVRLLGDKLEQMIDLARDSGLEPLVEAHTADEIQAAVESGARYVGVNSRNLDTLEINPGLFEEMSKYTAAFPGIIWVAESGFRTEKEVMKAFELGYNGVLVGTRLNAYEDGIDFLTKICALERK